MNPMEKLAYLKGLIEGLGLDETKKDTKVINNLIDLIEDIVFSLHNLEGTVDEMQQQVDAVDEDLGEIEKDLYDDDCGCCGDDNADDIYYEVTCPTCGESIQLDDEQIDQREIDCPNCGEKLEFDLEG